MLNTRFLLVPFFPSLFNITVWNHTQLGRFNWSWFDVTSFEPYEEETSYENSLLVQHTGALALSSLVHVFRSLTPNARGIFILIAQHQLEEKDNSNYRGKHLQQDLERSVREASLLLNSIWVF